MSKRSLKKTITVLVSIILALIFSECLLRAVGFKPWSYTSIDANEPTMHAPDPVLGWRNKKGNYVVPPYHPSGKSTVITFQDNGQRRTGVDVSNTEGEIVVVGGSFSQGWGIRDSETYAWKLQQEYPSLKVVNYGTGGYGSYQSLLVLEQELPRMTSPKFVLYGFIDHHEVRNVASASWLRILSSYSRRGHVATPFATVDENNDIVRHLPEGYLSLPFRKSSAVIEVIERAYMRIKTMKRFKQRRIVTEAILLQMDKLSKDYGATFFVVLLNFSYNTKSHYMSFLQQNHIQFIDCDYPLTEDMTVPGEGHPNGEMHALWAQRMSSVLDDQLKKINSSKTHVNMRD